MSRRDTTNDTTPPPHATSDSIHISLWDRVNRVSDRIDGVERAVIVGIGTDGKNGRLSDLGIRFEGSRKLLIALAFASISIVASGVATWISMSERVTRIEANQEIIIKRLETMK